MFIPVLACVLSAHTAVASLPTGQLPDESTVQALVGAAGFQFRSGENLLKQTRPEDNSRSAELAGALLLIVSPPQTRTKLDEAARRLEALSALPFDDAVAAEAAYQRVRLAQTRGELADTPLAGRYREIWTRFPDSPQAERAIVYAAIVVQHQPGPMEARRTALLTFEEEVRGLLRSPAARRLYHLSASLAWGRLFDDEDRACAHLLVVYELGLASHYTFSDVLFRLGEYHRRKGEEATAARFFREFVARYPADRRTDLARCLALQLQPHEP